MSEITPEEIAHIIEGDQSGWRKINEYVAEVARNISPKNLDYREELTQQVLVKLFDGGIYTYNPELSNPDTWINTIIRNAHIDNQRRITKRREVSLANTCGDNEGTYEQNIEDRRSLNGSPFTQEEREEVRKRVDKVLQKRFPSARYSFALAHYRKMPYKQISDTLGIPEGTVKSGISSIIKTLREEKEKLIA